MSVMLRDYPGAKSDKPTISIGHTTFAEHASIARFPPELQSLHCFLQHVTGDLRHIFQKFLQREEWTKPVCSRLLSMLAGHEWIHDIWVHGEDRSRTLGNGDLDLTLNSDLARDFNSSMAPFGVLISAYKRGELLEPANRIIFTIFIVIGSRDIIHIVTNGLVFAYQFVSGDRLVLAREAVEICECDTISFGDRFARQIPNKAIQSKCVVLEDSMQLFNAGLAGNLMQLLNRGGILIYGSFPNSEFDEARYLQGELKPIAHLIYCAMGEAKVPGGANLIDVRPVYPDRRITSFLFSSKQKKILDDIIRLWPR